MHAGVADKLERGLRRLARADDDPDALGAALISLHGALEDHFRATLAATTALGPEQQAAAQDVRRTQWKELLDLMQLHGGLTAEARGQITRANAQRQEVAHGGRFRGSRADLETYADLVTRLVGYQPPPVRPQARQKPARADDPGATLVLDDRDDPAPIRRGARPPEAQPAGRPTKKPAKKASAPAKKPAAQPAARRGRGWTGALAVLLLLGAVACSTLWALLAPPPATTTGAATSVAAPDTSGFPTPFPTRPALPRGATVGDLGGVPLLVRSAPSLAAEPLARTLSEGERITVVGGPAEVDGYLWWQIDVDGGRGWCAGAYLTLDP